MITMIFNKKSYEDDVDFQLLKSECSYAATPTSLMIKSKSFDDYKTFLCISECGWFPAAKLNVKTQ